MKSKTLPEQMNGVFNVHFVVTKLKASDSSKYSCQIVARHEYHDTSLHTATPGILVVEPRNSCITLFNAQVNIINDKYSYIDDIEQVDYTKADNTIFTKKRISLLTEMAIVVFNKLIKEEPWDKVTWSRKADTNLVEPLFTITETGLDEMIKRDLTITYTTNYA